MSGEQRLRAAVRVVRSGGVIAYPTEAVYGLGCDPADERAVRRLLALKQRSPAKGLILIAAQLEQLQRWLQPLDPPTVTLLRAEQSHPVTWLLPARADAPRWLRGAHTTLAIRLTQHPLAAKLCELCRSALVSTSANLSGRPPARDPLAVRRQFGQRLDYLLTGSLGGAARPSEIRAPDGRVLRVG